MNNGNYKRLSLGCGDALPDGADWVGIDLRRCRDPRVVQHDLEERPWPIEDESCSLVVAGMIIEHVNPAKMGTFHFMDEIWRVLIPDAPVAIATPYAGSPLHWTDPGHLTAFNESSWFYFDPLHSSNLYKVYKPKPWKLKTVTFNSSGLMEIIMEKRREDRSYAE